MAYTKKTTTPKTENIEEKESTAKKEVRKFNATDAIECKSIVSGCLGMIGIKSGVNYEWAGRGDVTEVEYQDLVAAIRSGKRHITEPFFIIQDEDFLAEFPQVQKIYTTMYSVGDLEDLLINHRNIIYSGIFLQYERTTVGIRGDPIIAELIIQSGTIKNSRFSF